MSQQLAPDPAAAAATLAATVPAQPDVSNRRDIPVTSFDFLQGAYVATRRVRSAALGVLAALTLLAAWTGYSVVSTRAETADAKAQTEQLLAQQEEAIVSLGAAIGSEVDVRLIIDRDIALTQAITLVAASQVDILKLLEGIENAPIGGVMITEIALGDQAVGDRAGLGAGPTPKVLLVGTSGELRRLVGWADALRSAGVLDSFNYVRSPGSIQVSGFTTVEAVSATTLEKVRSLGITIDVTVRPASPPSSTAPSDSTAPDEEEES